MMLLEQPNQKSKIFTIPNFVLAFYLAASIVNYIVGTEVFRDRYFVLMFIFLFGPQVLYPPSPHGKHIQIMALMLGVGAIFTFLNVRVMAFMFLGSTLLQIGIAGFILRYRHRISEKIPEYGFYLFLIYSMVLFIENRSFEYHFTESGRNTVSWLAISFCALYYGIIFLQGRSPTNFIPPLLAFIICVIAQGRSGIITSFLLFVTSFWYCTRKIKSNYLMWTVSAIVLIGFSVYVSKNTDFFKERIEYLTEKGLEGRTRNELIISYLDGLNALTVMTGVDIRDTLAGQLHGNPHNSYIIGHVRYGGMALVLYSIMIYLIVRGFIDKRKRFMAIILLTLALRMLTDMLAFVQPFDFVIYLLIFALLHDPGKELLTEEIYDDQGVLEYEEERVC